MYNNQIIEVKIVHIISNTVFFISLIFAIIITDRVNTLGWNFPRIYIDIFVSPFIFLILFFLTHILIKLKAIKHNFNFLLSMNILSVIFICYLVIMSFANSRGLYSIHSFYDNHFSHSRITDKYFHPHIGFIGIYISYISYFSCRFMSKMNKKLDRKKEWNTLLFFFPLLTYFLILYTQ